MGKVTLSVEIDQALYDRLVLAGVDPQAYLARLLRHKEHMAISPTEREARAAAWRGEHAGELESYDRFVEENGLWSDGLRTF